MYLPTIFDLKVPDIMNDRYKYMYEFTSHWHFQSIFIFDDFDYDVCEKYADAK